MTSEAVDAVAFDEPEEELERVDAERERAFGRYELCYHVASGGMASVYLARAVGPGGFRRPVAIKRIHPHLARRRQFVQMFLDEARIACRINHPNVCSIFDFGELDGTYFIAMEYLMGATLGRLVTALSREDASGGTVRHLEADGWRALAARIVADAAEGLHAAHELSDERGKPLDIVHRDVSPQNVFVTFDGAVKVVDFGIAHARDRLQHTETGTVKGKFGYMAPEQGSGRAVDRRADVWSLGVCLWEMLTGKRLFRRASAMETLKAVERQDVPPPSKLRAGVPEALDAIVLRCLERDRDRRPATARELARELEAFVRATGEPTGLSDLGEWMDPLFGREHSQKSELVQTMLDAHEVSTHITPKRGATASEDVISERARIGGDTSSLPLPPSDEGASSPEAGQEAEADHEAKARETSGSIDAPAAPEALAAKEAPAASEAPVAGEASAAPDMHDPSPSERPRWLPWGVGLLGGAGVAMIVAVAVLSAGGRSDEAVVDVAASPVAREADSDHSGVSGAASPSHRGRTGAAESAAVGAVGSEVAGSEQNDQAASDSTASDSPAPDSPASDSPASDDSRPRATADRSAHRGATDRARANRRRAARAAERRADRASSPASSAGHGHANVAVVGGWAEIWHGGRRLGQTPMRVRLPAGRQTLVLRPFGRGPTRRVTVDVRADRVTPVVVEL